MDKNNFLNQLETELEKIMGKEVGIRVQKVRKNNGVIYTGLVLQNLDVNIAPTIYVDDFYEKYQEGEGIHTLAEQIVQVYEKGKPKDSVDMDFFVDFMKVKDRIAFRLVHKEKNKELLEDIPYIDFLDLAICFYYAFYNEELGDGMILIHNSHMEMWKTNKEELLSLAKKNTEKLFPPVLMSMEAIMQECFEVSFGELQMYVLTNKQRCQGAASILFPKMLEEIARKIGGDFLILPSSVHEVIAIKAKEQEDVEMLHQMIAEVNGTQLSVEEVLAEYPYYYDSQKKELRQTARITN